MTSLSSIPCLSLSIACSLTDLEPAALTGTAFSACCLPPHTPTTKEEPLCPVYCSDGLESPSPWAKSKLSWFSGFCQVFGYSKDKVTNTWSQKQPSQEQVPSGNASLLSSLCPLENFLIKALQASFHPGRSGSMYYIKIIGAHFSSCEVAYIWREGHCGSLLLCPTSAWCPVTRNESFQVTFDGSDWDWRAIWVWHANSLRILFWISLVSNKVLGVWHWWSPLDPLLEGKKKKWSCRFQLRIPQGSSYLPSHFPAIKPCPWKALKQPHQEECLAWLF